MFKVVVLVLALTGMTIADHWRPAKKYTVNLDAKPEERWSELAREHAEQLKTLCAEMMKLVESHINALAYTALTRRMFDLHGVPHPYRKELMGIMKATGLSTKEVLLMNSIYELTAFEPPNGADPNVCTSTSIVAQTLNDKIYHARNMDYPFTSLLKDLTVQVDFVENGKVSYTGTTFVGYVGLLTGQKPHRFTLALNQRKSNHGWSQDLLDIMTHSRTCSLLIRDTLARPSHNDQGFEVFVDLLPFNLLLTSCYIVVGGVSHNEGAVVTIGPSVGDVLWLGSHQNWFHDRQLKDTQELM